MKTMFLKSEFIPLVLSGHKTQTIRQKTVLKIGDIITINFQKPICKVDSIRWKSLEEITDVEVKQDGFQTRKQFLAKIREIYPAITPKTKVALIKFHLISSPKT